MLRRTLPLLLALAACYALIAVSARRVAGQDRPGVQRVTWEDLAPLHARLENAGISGAAFPDYVDRVHDTNVRRVRQGDLDHLVFYILQSTRFTRLPPIEPALSAKRLVQSLAATQRKAFLEDPEVARGHIPEDVRSRLRAFAGRLERPSPDDPRFTYFRSLVLSQMPDRLAREAELSREYLRAMRFIYEKEFVAQHGEAAGTSVAELYRERGLSTDTAIEAGYVVYLGLGVLRALEPDRRVRRVLIVGPGLDLAPRTGLLEVGPPESYQPWAVIDALVSLGLARLDDLEVTAADLNPRVVAHLRRAHEAAPVLTLVSGIGETGSVSFSDEYRAYFTRLGAAIGEPSRSSSPGSASGGAGGAGRHLAKSVRVRPASTRVLRAETVDIVTERLAAPAFDLVIATNILPYFSDVELMLAMGNIGAMLAPGGVFLHNEARPLLGEVTTALGLPLEQSRHAVIATVRGAPAPLFDSVWLHRKRGSR